MNASKEEARRAKVTIQQLRLMLTETKLTQQSREQVNDWLRDLTAFIEAAQRKLPKEESYERAKSKK